MEPAVQAEGSGCASFPGTSGQAHGGGGRGAGGGEAVPEIDVW